MKEKRIFPDLTLERLKKEFPKDADWNNFYIVGCFKRADGTEYIKVLPREYVEKEANGIKIRLDTSIDIDLYKEGLASELAAQIISLRKKQNFSSSEKIVVSYKTESSFLDCVINQFEEMLTKRLNCSFIPNGDDKGSKITIDDNDIYITLTKSK